MITITLDDASNLIKLIDRASKHAPAGGAQDVMTIAGLLIKLQRGLSEADADNQEILPSE